MSDVLSAPHFRDDEAACALLESIRWAGGRVCPHCGTADRSYVTSRRQRNGAAVYRCGEPTCRKDFSVTTKSVMESSHIALHKWMQGFYLMSSSKKGVSAHQLHRSLAITYKAAWFMAHRIREAMRAGGLLPPMGGEGKIVEADETYYGKTEHARVSPQRKGRPYNPRGSRGPKNKRPIVALVERGGSVRTFHVAVADKANINRIISENIARESRLHTDESRLYSDAHEMFASHETVTHSRQEYVRGDVHTNSAEGYFGVFKKGMRGIYQHCAEKHLHRYLSEYDFRFNHRVALGFNDIDRTKLAVEGAAGKRLTYR